MKVNPHIFRGYDIRGLVGKDLSPELALCIGKAHGTYLKNLGQKKAVVGRDCRETSPEYSRKVIEGLSWAGIDVVDIGMQMVGTFYWSQYHLKIPGGIFVTASHNPPEFNGFKLANDYSETLVSDGIQEIRRLIEADSCVKGDKPGIVEEKDVLPAYYADLKKRLDISHNFKVVVDPGNSTAGSIVPPLLRELGCEVVEYNTEIIPSFPLGTADPTETKVAKRLSQEVLESKADIGFTYDADGDRIGIVDEKGGVVWNDVLVAIFASDVLKDHPGATIMYNTLCSKVVSDTISQKGGTPFMWRTGHSFLKKKNQEVKAAFIGELSGHFFFSADFYNHDDGVYSTLRLLQYLTRTKQKLSEAVAQLPNYISSPEIKVYCDDTKKADLVNEIAPILSKDYPDAEIINDQRAGDGIRLEMQDGMFVIRYSQNGPYLTIKFEAKTQEKYDRLKRYISELLHKYPQIDWESDISVNVEELSA
jgi:phosphomannomutase/phosphoglucomutase